ncbi:hypothetical protein OG478_21100 [Streptomyces phaeochromogenes]|uniref:hypothetical protein n=1 Tax=Streptomyces phaeochromogenes TaxID=1923 RepID=UPI0038680B11|nr:hypothetical protein OG478_21100 [Streptomyces phaeochromogenes]
MAGSKMNPDRATVLAWLRQALADELDDPMRVIGFKRRVRGVSYSRHWGDGRQKVDIELIVRPHYAPDAIQVSLSVSFVSAGIADVARRMLPEGDEDVARKDVVERSVLDQVMRNPPVLAFRDECELRDLVSHLKGWLKSSVISYMDARNPVEEFAREGNRSLMVNSGDGFPRGPRPVVLAAVQKFLGYSDDALATLESAYPPEAQERAYYRGAFIAVNANYGFGTVESDGAAKLSERGIRSLRFGPGPEYK